jgi:hypothetical protein
MGLFHNLLLSIVHLLLVALDITGFFLLVKLIYWRWPRPWLLPWEQLGNSLVEHLTRPLQRSALVRADTSVPKYAGA